MCIYRAIQIFEGNAECMDLVNIFTNRRIMLAPDEFLPQQIVFGFQFTLREANYVDDQGIGTGYFAFKREWYAKMYLLRKRINSCSKKCFQYGCEGPASSIMLNRARRNAQHIAWNRANAQNRPRKA